MQEGYKPKGANGAPSNPPARSGEGKPAPCLPVLRTPEGIVKSLDDWREFARRDDCLDRMVPSDLRTILSNL